MLSVKYITLPLYFNRLVLYQKGKHMGIPNIKYIFKKIPQTNLFLFLFPLNTFIFCISKFWHVCEFLNEEKYVSCILFRGKVYINW